VRLDNTADIVKDRYFLFPTWCYVKRICDALFDVVTNMSVHIKEDITSLEQCMLAFRYTRCNGTLQLQIDFVMLSVQ